MLTHLHELHLEMDEEVCEAYGWPHEVLDDEEEMLERAENKTRMVEYRSPLVIDHDL